MKARQDDHKNESNTYSVIRPVERVRPHPNVEDNCRPPSSAHHFRAENIVKFRQGAPAVTVGSTGKFHRDVQHVFQDGMRQNFEAPIRPSNFASTRMYCGQVTHAARPTLQRPNSYTLSQRPRLQTAADVTWYSVRRESSSENDRFHPQIRNVNSVEVNAETGIETSRRLMENESNQNMKYREVAANPLTRPTIVRNHAFMPRPRVMGGVEYVKRIIDGEESVEESVIRDGRDDHRTSRTGGDKRAAGQHEHYSDRLNVARRAECTPSSVASSVYRAQQSDGGRPVPAANLKMAEGSRMASPFETRRQSEDALNQYDLFTAALNSVGSNTTLKDKNSIPTKENTEKKLSANNDAGRLPSNVSSELRNESSTPKTPVKNVKTLNPKQDMMISEKRKVPMNKVTVGAAPSPNLKEVRSKIGSLENYTHKPGGGQVKIENRKLAWRVQPRIEAKNDQYNPSGGVKKIPQQKLQWNAKSKIGSLDNATHKPGGGDKRIETVKLDFKDKAKSKVGSKDNIKHTPGGGSIKIEDQKIEIKAQSKVGSLDNVKHRPGGGDKKIFDDKDYLKQSGPTNPELLSVTTSESQSPIHITTTGI